MRHADDVRIDVRAGLDTDGDGVPDTAVFTDGELLRLAADTDRDGLADVIVEIGPDASAYTTMLGEPDFATCTSFDAVIESSD